MKFLKITMILALTVLAMSSCKKDDEVTTPPAELIIGTWTVESRTVLGVTVPDGSSQVTFSPCGTDVCAGEDSNLVSQNNGSFTYELSADGKSLDLDVTSSEVALTSGNWQVDELTANRISMQTGVFFVSDQIILTK